MIKINLINQYDNNKTYKKIIKHILKLASTYLKLTERNVISVILVSNDTIHDLNKQYRDIDKPTDVLSFENVEGLSELGDVFISIDRIKEQADELKNPFDYELAYISLHGFLHCLGYDHITDEDNLEMTTLQESIMALSKYKR